mmetsp:Transcript_18299/g.34964  ORF Transcript_18299/g.34964 Transcript_18299/m.34964 type:complete len:344 (-) Transcript_18299:132-1163(-)|eukprot:scaffold4232_cov215-Amphora_coffeaeformis.AAC.10
MILYHYTSSAGYEGIQRTQQINASTGGKYGFGVYLTDLDPTENERQDIAKELYRSGGVKNLASGKLDHYVAVDLLDFMVERAPGREHVFVYRDDLRLNEHEIISQGSSDDWEREMDRMAATMAAEMAVIGLGVAAFKTAVTVTRAGVGLYNTSLNGRERRLLELKTKLQNILDQFLAVHENAARNNIYSVEPTTDKGVRLVCKHCLMLPLSETFYGGMFYASTMDTNHLIQKLTVHEVLHGALRQFFCETKEKISNETYAIQGCHIRCNRCFRSEKYPWTSIVYGQVLYQGTLSESVGWSQQMKEYLVSSMHQHEFWAYKFPVYMLRLCAIGVVLVAVMRGGS